MKTKLVTLFLILLVSILNTSAQQTTTASAAAATQHSLMPVPASIQFQPGRLAVTGAFHVATKNYSDARLQSAIGRMMARLAGRTDMTLTPGIMGEDSGSAANNT